MSNLTQENDWGCLPPGILDLVLYYVKSTLPTEINKFRAVCKGWNRVYHPTDHLSVWIVQKIVNKSTLAFYHPLADTRYPYTINIENPNLDGASFHCSKHGWLLMSRGYDTIFFFNPFSRSTILLPTLPPYNGKFYTFTFTSPPTSEDCLVFAILPHSFNSMDILTFSKAKGDWTKKTCCHYDFTSPSYTNSVYHNGKLFCLDKTGPLGVFDCETTDLTILETDFGIEYADEGHLLDFGGELTTVFKKPRLETDDEEACLVVFKLKDENSTPRWHRVKDIGEYMFYLSAKTSLAKKSTRHYMGNKIYFPISHDNHGVFFSMEDYAFQTWGNGLESRSFDNTSRINNSCWMEIGPALKISTSYMK